MFACLFVCLLPCLLICLFVCSLVVFRSLCFRSLFRSIPPTRPLKVEPSADNAHLRVSEWRASRLFPQLDHTPNPQTHLIHFFSISSSSSSPLRLFARSLANPPLGSAFPLSTPKSERATNKPRRPAGPCLLQVVILSVQIYVPETRLRA